MWFNSIFGSSARTVPLYLYNTLGKAKQEFTLPLHASMVKMYNCGPTVYGPQHIGNLSMFVFTDILRRALEYNNFTIKQAINFTDFGHLTSDADEGEDKMMKGLKREGLKPTVENMRTMGKKYAESFKEDLKQLNIAIETITFPFASDYIPAQIAMIQTLEQKGYAYKTARGVYFDTSAFSSYGELGGIDQATQLEGARVAVNPEKRNPADFILWKSDGKMGWDSPWGKGFPGWHIECSAMIHSILGKQIDIHTGGIEHISIHHNNEIAQSESATGKRPFSRFWLHRAHLQIEGAKIAKSEGNTIFLSDIVKKGFHPLAFRYLLLGAHYRTPASFSWEALEAAQNALFKLYYDSADFFGESGTNSAQTYMQNFHERINDDLDTPGALAVTWEMLKDPSVSADAKREALKAFDAVLGLDIASHLAPSSIPPEVEKLVQERTEARSGNDWERADVLRKEIESLGYTVKDTEQGPRVRKNATPQQQS